MITRIARIGFFASIAVLLSALLASSGSRPAKARPEHISGGKCIHVGESIITNFGGVDANTTLGPATGDLRGAVAATLLTPPQPGSGGTVLFNVQHHWITESGDNIYFDKAVATTLPLSQTRFAIVNRFRTSIAAGCLFWDHPPRPSCSVGTERLRRLHCASPPYSGSAKQTSPE